MKAQPPGETPGAQGPSTSDGETTTLRAPTAVPSRFHATKEVTINRVVRDVGQIYEQIVSHFVASDVPVRVTVDIESDQLNKLTED